MLTTQEIGRVNLYLDIIRKALRLNKEFISIDSIAHFSGIDRDIIYSDFLSLSIPNGEKSIHELSYLLDYFEKIIGVEPNKDCFLLGNLKYIEENFNRIALFHKDLRIISIFSLHANAETPPIYNIPVAPLEDVFSLTTRMNIEHWLIYCKTSNLTKYIAVSKQANIRKVFINAFESKFAQAMPSDQNN